MNENALTRRELLGRGTMIAVGLSAPSWLSAVAKADVARLAAGGNLDPDNVLVVVQLSGGNDGLNTVIPYADANYYKFRANLAIPENDILKLDGKMGLHPGMKRFHELFKENKVAIIQNVGYPNKSRSHFKSMDIWQTASPEGTLRYGWIGRAMDERIEEKTYTPVSTIGLTTERPLALTAKNAAIPTFARLGDIENLVGDADSEKLLRDIQGSDATRGSTMRLIQDANRAALDAMSELNTKLKGVKTSQTYGDNNFGRGFQQIAQLILASPRTRVIYLSVGGFDTHAQQLEQHANLLTNFSDGLHAFQREMEASGKASKVTVLVFSEFGRRVEKNGSEGTDHGEAAPMFLIGAGVKGGLHGSNPDLANLNQGDVPFKTDFREVYATVLDKWTGNDSGLILGRQFKHLDVIK